MKKLPKNVEWIYDMCNKSIIDKPTNDMQEGFNLALSNVIVHIQHKYKYKVKVYKTVEEFVKSLDT